MRIDRLDIPRHGGEVTLHPRLTVLQDVAPELRAVVLDVAATFAGARGRQVGGVVEVNGVRLHIDDPTVGQMHLDLQVSPVLRLDAPPTANAPSADDDIEELRSRLRGLATEREALDRAIEAATARLDAQASSSASVASGRISALEARRDSLRSAHERAVQRARQAEVARDAIQDQLEALAAAAGAVPADALRSILVQLDIIGPTPAPLPVDVDALAGELESAIGEAQAAFDRRELTRRAIREAREAADAAAAAVRDAERSARIGPVDTDLVRRLERIRDEIFGGDEPSRRQRNRVFKQRISELRAEEAVVLDQLGFDTYSSYVMGVRSEPDAASAEELRDSRARMAEARSRLAHLEAADTDDDSVHTAVWTMIALAREARRVVGAVEELPDPDQVVAAGALSPELTSQTRSLVSALSDQHAVAAAEHRGRIAALVAELNEALVDARAAAMAVVPNRADASVLSIPESAVPETPAPTPPDVAPVPVDPGAVEGTVKVWLRWQEAALEWSDVARRRLGRVGEGDEVGAALAEWAAVEAELDAALDRMGAAQERSREHDSATAEVAQLRESQLEIRARERELLDLIARNFDRDPAPDRPAQPDGTTVAGGGPAGAEVGIAVAVEVGADLPAEWRVIELAAQLRSVSFVGSVPLVIDGVGSDPVERRLVLDRLDRLSDLVQVIVLSDDPAVADMVAGYGDRAAVV